MQVREEQRLDRKVMDMLRFYHKNLMLDSCESNSVDTIDSNDMLFLPIE